MPKQSLAQKIGRIGERWFENQLPSDWIFQYPSEDVGIDGQVIICDNSLSNGLEFRVQIKTSNQFTKKDDFIHFRVSKRDLTYWLKGLTPTLICLYETSTLTGWYSWINQVIVEQLSKINDSSKSILIKLSVSKKLDHKQWDKISNQVYSINKNIGSNLILAGMAYPVLKAIEKLMGSLELIEICKHIWTTQILSNKISIKEFLKKSSNCQLKKVNDYLDAELTAHKEIATTLYELERKLEIAQVPSIGLKEAGDKYCEICTKFVSNFNQFITSNGSGFKLLKIDIEALFTFREKANREVIQLVNRLVKLTSSLIEK